MISAITSFLTKKVSLVVETIPRTENTIPKIVSAPGVEKAKKQNKFKGRKPIAVEKIKFLDKSLYNYVYRSNSIKNTKNNFLVRDILILMNG